MERHIPRSSKDAANHLLKVNQGHDVIYIPQGDTSDVEASDSSASDGEESADDQNVTGEEEIDGDISNNESEDPVEDDTRWYFRWRKIRPPGSIPTFTPASDLEAKNLESLDPYELFKRYIPTDVFEKMAHQTNLYSVLQSGSSINTNSLEMEQFIGIFFWSSICQAGAYRDYWSPLTRWPPIANVMGQKRFEILKQFFHLCDNTIMKKVGEEGYDPLYKFRLLLDCVRSRCRDLPCDEHQSIDEQVVPFKGRHRAKQYIPSKPNKWGFKFISRASSTGLLYDFILYSGKNTELIKPLKEFSMMNNIVRSLCLTIPVGTANLKLYMDNYYNTLQLALYLKKEMNIHVTGTMRANRLHNAPLMSEKELKEKGRGSCDHVVDANSALRLVRWYDKRAVTLLSTCYDQDPFSIVRRWDGKKGEMVSVPIPFIVKQYNQKMGGVDLQDMLSSLYRINRKSKKYYMRIVFFLLGVAAQNSWMEYRRHLPPEDDTPAKRMSLKDFIIRIASGLTKCGKASAVARPGRPSTSVTQPLKRRAPNEAHAADLVRFDQIDHFPIHKNKGRCKKCVSGFSRWICEKCEVHLCLNSTNNCFKEFHVKQ